MKFFFWRFVPARPHNLVVEMGFKKGVGYIMTVHPEWRNGMNKTVLHAVKHESPASRDIAYKCGLRKMRNAVRKFAEENGYTIL